MSVIRGMLLFAEQMNLFEEVGRISWSKRSSKGRIYDTRVSHSSCFNTLIPFNLPPSFSSFFLNLSSVLDQLSYKGARGMDN